MAWKIEIGGVDKTTAIHLPAGVRLTLPLNGRTRATFTTSPGYSPARFAAVTIYDTDGTTALFGGFILQRRLTGLAFGVSHALTECEAVGLDAYLDWATVSLSWATDPTLQDVLDDLIAALPAGYGITLDATDYSATTLSAFAWTNVRASDALRELCDRTGLIYTMSPAGVLALAAPGGSAAPMTITDGDPNCRELVWTDPSEPPVTTVKLLCGEGTATVVQTWTANGTDTSWVTDLPGTFTAGYVTVGGIFMTVGTGAMYEWDPATHTLSVGTASTPTNGTLIKLTYEAQYPFTVTATTAGTPDVTRVFERTDVFDVAQGQEIADGLLDQLSATAARQVEVVTLEAGWRPGQEVTVDLTNRAVDATCAITEVEISLETDTYWVYRFTAVELTVYDGGYLAAWRALLAGSASGAGSVVTSATGGDVTIASFPGPIYLGGSRFHAVQVPA